MPFKRHNSPFWWASYVDAGGRRVRRSTQTEDKREAEVLEAHRQKMWGEQPVRTFGELMLAYLDGPSQSKRSKVRDEFSAKQLYPVFQGRELHALTRGDVRDYISKRQAAGVSAGTINKELGLFRTALNWARTELEWEVPNPFTGRKLQEPEARTRWLTPEEAQRLLVAAGLAEREAPHLEDFIRLGLHTGMRPGEMLELEWNRVDLPRGLIYLGAQHQKNGKVGGVPLNKDARATLIRRAGFRARHCPASPWVFCNKEG